MRVLLGLVIGGLIGATGVVRPASAAEPSVVDAQRVRQAIAHAVRARMGEDAHVEISGLEVEGQGFAEFVEAVPFPDARVGGRVQFRLLDAGGGGERARHAGRASAVIGVEVEHVRARTLLPRGRDVAEDDIEASRDRLPSLPLRRLPRSSEVTGARALVHVAPGEVVTRSAVSARAAVRSGQTVRAIARVDGLEVVASLVAVQDGAPGAVIRVVNRESRKELRARVVAGGVVEVVP